MHIPLRLLAIITLTMKRWVLLICLLPTAIAAADEPWAWKDSKGAVRTQADLNSILNDPKQHVYPGGCQAKWSTAGALVNADLRNAQLAGANLSGFDLTGANLDQADFTEANLERANLTSAILTNADFTQANLSGASLNGAHLNGAYLAGTDLTSHGALLKAACLTAADLTGADLTNADLTKADLRSANMTDSQMAGANLKGLVYQPQIGPDLLLVSDAGHLADLRWKDDPRPIVSLRNALFSAGFEQAGKEVNRAYRHQGENLLQRLLFDWTCAWGADPVRPLQIIGEISLLCTLIYWIVIHFEWAGAGLYLIVSEQQVSADEPKKRVVRIHVPGYKHKSDIGAPGQKTESVPLWRRFMYRTRLEFTALGTAFMFSLMSVFTLGVEGFNCGQWLRMLQPREFDIRACGWVRTVSGLQALLGAGLITLAVLSYFGHPFA